jgi:cation:H+ antiporter
MDNELSLIDSVILLSGMIIMIVWITRLGLRDRRDPLSSEFDDEIPKGKSITWSVTWLVIGLAVLLASSKMVVWGATNVAQYFGISDLIIGLTIIAIGTSLPELAASILCVLRKEDDMAIGNVIGSNMFNLLGVMGLPGLIMPFSFEASAVTRDFVVMFGFCLALFAMSYGFKRPGRVNRIEGSVLLTGYIAYMVVLYITAVGVR